MIYLPPEKVVIQSDGGSADMGVVTNEISPARFGPRARGGDERLDQSSNFLLLWVRVHFSGTGSTTADMGIQIDSGRDIQYDTLLWTEEDRGLNADVTFRVPQEELFHWVLEPWDQVVLTWTNPHAQAVVWGATVGLASVKGL